MWVADSTVREIQNKLLKKKKQAMSSSVSRVNMEVSVSEAYSQLGTCVNAPQLLTQHHSHSIWGSALTWTGWMHGECFEVLSTTEQQLRCSSSRPFGFIQVYIICLWFKHFVRWYLIITASINQCFLTKDSTFKNTCICGKNTTDSKVTPRLKMLVCFFRC